MTQKIHHGYLRTSQPSGKMSNAEMSEFQGFTQLNIYSRVHKRTLLIHSGKMIVSPVDVVTQKQYYFKEKNVFRVIRCVLCLFRRIRGFRGKRRQSVASSDDITAFHVIVL